MFCSLCHSLLVYLLENQLKPAFPEAFPNLSVGIYLFFINVQCVVLNWRLHKSIQQVPVLCFHHSQQHQQSFTQGEVLKNLIEDIAKCLLLLCQPKSPVLIVPLTIWSNKTCTSCTFFFAALVTLLYLFPAHIYLFCDQVFYVKLSKFQDSAIPVPETSRSPFKSSWNLETLFLRKAPK